MKTLLGILILPELLPRPLLPFDARPVPEVEDVDLDELPEPTELPAEDVQPASALCQALAHWHAAGGMQPFDWAALQPVLGEGRPILTVASKLLGNAWVKLYPEAPRESEVVPKQVAFILHHVLQSYKELYNAKGKNSDHTTSPGRGEMENSINQNK